MTVIRVPESTTPPQSQRLSYYTALKIVRRARFICVRLHVPDHLAVSYDCEIKRLALSGYFIRNMLTIQSPSNYFILLFYYGRISRMFTLGIDLIEGMPALCE